MVKLKNIKTEACPICGCAVIVSESIDVERGDYPKRLLVHCSGGMWEYREFLCGYKTHYSPNFMREECHKKCSNDPEENRKNMKRQIAKAHILTEIEQLDCDEKFKESLRFDVQYK